VRDLGISKTDFTVYRGKGCAACNFTGFFGRTAIYEILHVNERIKDLIARKAPSTQIKRTAMAQGMRTLRQDGWQKVLSGFTTPGEVLQVTSAEEEDAPHEEPLSISGFSAPQDKGEESMRAFERVDRKLNLRYNIYLLKEQPLEGGPSAERLAVTKNISAGGLLFVSNFPLPVGSIIELKLELPDVEPPVQCLSRIVRVEETDVDKVYEIAVHFLDITSAGRARIKKYISSIK
jgi:hypothetical protein